MASIPSAKLFLVSLREQAMISMAIIMGGSLLHCTK